MKDIQQSDTWLGKRLADMGEAELAGLFEEIANFRKTGLLKGERLRSFAKEFSDNVTHSPYNENMRLVESEILYEMSRRFYNSLFF